MAERCILFITLLWLILTAPLSRALEPLDDPALRITASDGTAIARRGAIKEAPVDVTKLDPLTPAAFIAIEDARGRSLDHAQLDPETLGALADDAPMDRVLVRLGELPRHLIDAVLVVEDRRFHDHHGLDPRRLAGALLRTCARSASARAAAPSRSSS